MIGLPAWNAMQGHGSFLTLEFGEPSLKVHEWHSRSMGLRRSAYVSGRWHLWIYCCHWRLRQDGTQAAWSEDPDDVIGRAVARLNGQKLTAVTVETGRGKSSFIFDLGGTLETWPYGDDPATAQWMIYAPSEVFTYRADGLYSQGAGDQPPASEQWLPLG